MENVKDTRNKKAIIVFDGVCNLCNRVVDFIIAHDKRNLFFFADKDGEIAKKLKNNAGLPTDITEKTMLLFENGTHYTKSRATLKILKRLGPPWALLYVFILIPTPLRDLLYDLISTNRLTLFGQKHVCRVMTKDLESRFLI